MRTHRRSLRSMLLVGVIWGLVASCADPGPVDAVLEATLAEGPGGAWPTSLGLLQSVEVSVSVIVDGQEADGPLVRWESLDPAIVEVEPVPDSAGRTYRAVVTGLSQGRAQIVVREGVLRIQLHRLLVESQGLLESASPLGSIASHDVNPSSPVQSLQLLHPRILERGLVGASPG